VSEREADGLTGQLLLFEGFFSSPSGKKIAAPLSSDGLVWCHQSPGVAQKKKALTFQEFPYHQCSSSSSRRVRVQVCVCMWPMTPDLLLSSSSTPRRVLWQLLWHGLHETTFPPTIEFRSSPFLCVVALGSIQTTRRGRGQVY
jgi:hypothetical protein